METPWLDPRANGKECFMCRHLMRNPMTRCKVEVRFGMTLYAHTYCIHGKRKSEIEPVYLAAVNEIVGHGT